MAPATMFPQSVWLRALHFLAWVGIVTGLILCLTVGYWQLAPYDGLIGVTQPFKVSHTVVPKGTLVVYTLQYCVDQSLPVPITIHRSLELQNNDPTAQVPSLPVAPMIEYEITNRCETRDFFVGLPSYVPVGKYHIHTNTALQVNPVRVVRQSWVSESFDVITSGEGLSTLDDNVAFPPATPRPYK